MTLFACLLAFVFSGLIANADELATISGRVYNPDRGQYVNNAEIRIGGTNIFVYSGMDGSYRIPNAPAGTLTLTVTHAAFQTQTATVTTEGGKSTTQDFDIVSALRSGDETLRLGAFEVTAEAEGKAKALMEQRASMNMKSVIAADAFGDLSEGNIGELLQYLPGVSIGYDQSDISTVGFRGLPSQYGALMVDGQRVTSYAGTSRTPGMTAMNIAAVEAIELNKTASASMDADAPAGSVNLKSKSAFSTKGRRVFLKSYISVNSEMLTLKRVALGYAKHHTYHPNVEMEYSNVFLDNKLGLVFGLSSTYTIHKRLWNYHTYNSMANPTMVTNVFFRDSDKANRADRAYLSLDYKMGPRATFSITGQLRDSDTRIYDHQLQMYVSSAANLNTGSDLNTMSIRSGLGRMQTAGAVQERNDRFQMYAPRFTYKGDIIELEAGFLDSKIGIDMRNGGVNGDGTGPFYGFITYHLNSTYTLTRSASDQTAWNISNFSGTDYHNINNWTTTASGVMRTNTTIPGDKNKYVGNVDVKITPKWASSTYFQTGVKSQREMYSRESSANTWTYNTAAGAPLIDSTIMHFDPRMGGNIFDTRIPWPDRSAIAGLFESNPQYFTKTTNMAAEDNYFRHREVTEFIRAAYALGRTQIKDLTLELGLRGEATRTRASTYDVKAAAAGQDPYKFRYGKYDDWFRFLAAKYRFTKNLMALASFNDSIMRTDYGNMIGSLTVNDNTLIGNIPNPNLKPEYAKNYAVRLEYYLPSAGILSIAGYENRFKDKQYRLTPNVNDPVTGRELGLDEEYWDYRFYTWANAGTFWTRGYEIEYSQQFAKFQWLPKALRGMGVFANQTVTKNSNAAYFYGNPGKTRAAGINYRYNRFSCAVNHTWTAETNVDATYFRTPRTIVNISASFRPTKYTSIFLTGRNITDEPYETRITANRNVLYQFQRFGSNWTIGIEGRF